MLELIAVTIINTSLKYGVEPELALAIAYVESAYNPNAIGKSHKEKGIFQLHPKYFPKAKLDVESNIEMGIKHLAWSIKRCKSKFDKAAFICYNVGVNNSRIKNPKQFQYYRKVMNVKSKISGRTFTQNTSKRSVAEILAAHHGSQGRDCGRGIRSGRELHIHPERCRSHRQVANSSS